MSNYNSIYTGAQFDSAVGTALSARAAQGLLKGDGNGGVTAAVAGTDYQKAVYSAGVDANGLMAFKDSSSNTMFSAQLPLYDGKQIINYGFHIDGSVSDPADAVTYLADAVGMKPAHMDYDNMVFDYGSWENAFFMPRPCMLKFDGTVDYYLDPDDYSKKADGTASDVATSTTANAMMEWGRDGYKIWYKIVPDDGDNTSASIYISNVQIDSGYHAWSFINNQGDYVDHFYTGIYEASQATGESVRSLSGTSLMNPTTTIYDVLSSIRDINSNSQAPIWTGVIYADYILISLLLLLVTKTRNGQVAIGCGVTNHGTCITNGTLDSNGLFYGAANMQTAVKVFGMENWWGNLSTVLEGAVVDKASAKLYYKMTYGTEDGSGAAGYWPLVCDSADAAANGSHVLVNSHLEGSVLVDSTATSQNKVIREMHFNSDSMFPYKYQAETASRLEYWCDAYYDGFCSAYASSQVVVRFGGDHGGGNGPGPFCINTDLSSPARTFTQQSSLIGYRLSCKPLAS